MTMITDLADGKMINYKWQENLGQMSLSTRIRMLLTGRESTSPHIGDDNISHDDVGQDHYYIIRVVS